MYKGQMYGGGGEAWKKNGEEEGGTVERRWNYIKETFVSQKRKFLQQIVVLYLYWCY